MRFKILVGIIALAFMTTVSFGMNLNDTFNLMTTPIVSSTSKGQAQGSGFYYHHLAPDSSGKTGSWRIVQNEWLITNRHIVLPKIDGKEVIPNTFTFYLRQMDGKKLQWDPVTLTKEELLKRALFHKNPQVDVAVIEIMDLLSKKIAGGGKYLQTYSVSPNYFAGENNINVQTSDDVVVIGYPRGFYDEVNLYPIVKSGIIASRWGADFNGKPYFLIDAKLFPGSSGSIVLSKPTVLVVKDGNILSAKEKQFAFLGIYSGEWVKKEQPVEFEGIIITEKAGFNLGVVWYANLIEEIISHGVRLAP